MLTTFTSDARELLEVRRSEASLKARVAELGARLKVRLSSVLTCVAACVCILPSPVQWGCFVAATAQVAVCYVSTRHPSVVLVARHLVDTNIGDGRCAQGDGLQQQLSAASAAEAKLRQQLEATASEAAELRGQVGALQQQVAGLQGEVGKKQAESEAFAQGGVCCWGLLL